MTAGPVAWRRRPRWPWRPRGESQERQEPPAPAPERLDLTAAATVEQELAAAVEQGELVLRFQPKVEASTGRILGVEALVRWVHPSHGEVLPAYFLPLAEETGIIVDIDRWVIGEACRQLARWDAANMAVPRVSVNVSARTLESIAVDRHVAEALLASGIDAGRLELEVTETELLKQPIETGALLARVRALGVRLAMDDFGTGYSSLGYLKIYRFDTLKIDRSFIVDLTTAEVDVTRVDRTIVGSIVHLADGLGLDLVAEGVETSVQRDALLELGCTEVQGYLFGAPMSADDLADLVPACRLAEPLP